MLSIIAGHMGNPYLVKITFAYHLTVYFILSGYTMRRERVSAAYCQKKFLRLMVPYFLTCFAVMAMDLFNMEVLGHNKNVRAVTALVAEDALRAFFASGTFTKFGDIDMGAAIGAIWFLPALFFSFILTQFILEYTDDKRKQSLTALSIAAAGSVTGAFLWLPFSLQAGAFAVPFLLLGFYARENKWLDKLKVWHVLLCLLIYAAGIKLGLSQMNFVTACAKKDTLITSIVGIAASAAVIWLCRRLPGCFPLEYIGRNSIWFLCIHLFELNTMGNWYEYIFQIMGIHRNVLTLFILRILFILTGTLLLKSILYSYRKVREKLKTRQKEAAADGRSDAESGDACCKTEYLHGGKRDEAVDMAKGLLITLTILGHYSGINEISRTVIYSFHMMAFVVLSGYFFNEKYCSDIRASLLRTARSFLIPYAVFGLIYIFINIKDPAGAFRNLIYGISFSKNWFTDIKSIGPVYFILLLFLIRAMYLFAAKYIPGAYLMPVMLLMSFCGYQLGVHGFWLMWSLDIALYGMIFYHLGYVLRKTGILQAITGWYPSYFILSSFWVYMIYKGGMEIAIREYGSYGVTIPGVLSAVMLLIMLCRACCGFLPHIFVRLTALVGKSTLYILIIHTLFAGRISRLLENLYVKGYQDHMVMNLLVSLAAGIIIFKVWQLIRIFTIRQLRNH